MAIVRKTLAAAAAAGTIDHARVDALTEDDVARFNAQDGFDPGDTLKGLRRVYSPAEIRERAGLTQADMAARLRVPVKTWRNWEQGRTSLDPAVRALLDLVADDPGHAFAVLDRGPRPTPDEDIAATLGGLEQAIVRFGESIAAEREPAFRSVSVAGRVEAVEVFGSDGARVGYAMADASGRLQVWAEDPTLAGHHYLTAGMVASVAGRITLAVPAAEAVATTPEAS